MEIGASEPIRVEGNQMVIPKGEPKATKEAFIGIMESRVQVLDRNSYARVAGAGSAMGHFGGVVYQIPEGKLIEDASIFVNEDDFHVGGEDFTDVIPVTVRHEIFEMWTYAKNGWSLSPAPERIGKENRVAVAHGLATREEYRHAFEIGKAERYLEFIRKWSNRLPAYERERNIRENEDAYKEAKAKYSRSIK